MQRTKEHIKRHHRETISKNQIEGNLTNDPVLLQKIREEKRKRDRRVLSDKSTNCTEQNLFASQTH